MYTFSVISKVQCLWKKRQNSDAIKEVMSKGQHEYPSDGQIHQCTKRRKISNQYILCYIFQISAVSTGVWVSMDTMLLETDNKPVKRISINKELVFKVFISSIFPPVLVDIFSVTLT